MIYLFYGNSEFLLSETVSKWKKQFSEKYWDFQLTHIRDYSQLNDFNLEQNILSQWLFDEKKLIILDKIPASSQWKDKTIQKLQDDLLLLLPRKAENVILVFISLDPDKRAKFFKYLLKLLKSSPEQIQIKEYNLNEESENIWFLQKKYPHVDYNILRYVLNIKLWAIEKAIWELDKMLIAHDTISLDLVKDNIIPEREESIFIFIESLLHNNKKQALTDMQVILEQSDIMSLYYGLLSNMRVIVYILLFLKLKKSKTEITSVLNLWKRSFLIDKYSRLSYVKISKLYMNLCSLDSKMKKWDLGQYSENWLQDALEILILEQ